MTKCSTVSRLALTVALLGVPLSAHAAFEQTNLVSDIPGLAVTTDPLLVNPWGMSSSPTGPFWVSNEATMTSTLYDGEGVKQALEVTIPGNPTGQVFNPGTGFQLAPSQPAVFMFATMQGQIAGWNPNVSATAAVTAAVTPGAVYTGLAEGTVSGQQHLYAADLAGAKIDVYDSSFAPTTLSGNFTDPNLPTGFAPFNVQRIGSTLYVAYAQAENGEEVPGAGLGVVDAFSLNGDFLRRVATGGSLNAPWGVALAPDEFGEFANALLIGNFGDGRINAFDPTSGAFLGQLTDTAGQPIAIEGLWALLFGNGVRSDTDDLYFTAGIEDETHGLFGEIAAVEEVPEPSSLALMAAALAGLRLRRRRR